MAITGNQTFNNWNWPNAMIFAATVITTIGKFLVTFRVPSPCALSSWNLEESGFGDSPSLGVESGLLHFVLLTTKDLECPWRLSLPARLFSWVLG